MTFHLSRREGGHGLGVEAGKGGPEAVPLRLDDRPGKARLEHGPGEDLEVVAQARRGDLGGSRAQTSGMEVQGDRAFAAAALGTGRPPGTS